MSWKKILFLCLSFIFVFVASFYTNEKGFAATGYDPITNTIGGETITDSSYREGVGNFYKTNTGTTYFVSNSGAKDPDGSLNAAKSSVSLDVAKKTGNSSTLEKIGVALNSFAQMANSITGSIENALLHMAAVFIHNIFLRLAALAAGISGYLFDFVIKYTVINMADHININASDGFINIGWKILRDVINIMFIFVLLYVGIMTIVKGFESGTSKMIATVIVVALLINFSLFFTKIIIDSSNIVAVNFYDAIKNASETAKKDHAWEGIAAVFIEKAGMGNLYKTAVLEYQGDKSVNVIIDAIMGIVLLAGLAIVIFIGTILFITRYLVLIIVLIASSAAIGSWILPSLKKSVYDKWWSALIGQAFFAPIFFLFLYLTIIFMQKTVGKNVTETAWGTLVTGAPSESGITLILNYLLIIGSFIGTMIVSKSLSNMAGSGAGKITGMLGGAALGGAALVGRNTFGRLGSSWNSDKAQEEARNATGFRRSILLARSAAGAKMKKGSFDARTAKGAGALLGAGGISAKDGLAVNKGGIVSDQKKWKSFKEDVRGTYTEKELDQKQQEAADKAAARGDKDIVGARAEHDKAKKQQASLNEEEKRLNEEYEKEFRDEEKKRIQDRLEEIQKEKELAAKNVEKTADAQDKAEKSVRKKALNRYKASKSDKDKVFEAAMKEVEKKKKEDEGSSSEEKPKK